MWFEIIFGVVIFKLLKRIFFDDDDDHLDFGSSGSNALFAVAHRLQTLYGGKAYVGLRIPDPDTASRQSIDLVLVTKGEAVVVSVINASGIVSIDRDGTWVCTGGSKHKTERHQDPALFCAFSAFPIKFLFLSTLSVLELVQLENHVEMTECSPIITSCKYAVATLMGELQNS
ncbi:NERD-like protein [Tanacetum coccineum]